MHVVLCRDEEESEAYASTLHDAGCGVHFLPVLSFALHDARCADAIIRCAQASDDGGEAAAAPRRRVLVVTSKRAAALLAELVRRDARVAACVQAVHLYALGFATAEALKTLTATVLGSGCASAEELAHCIVRDAARDAAGGPPTRAMFLCGSRRLDTLGDTLRAGGVEVHEQVVYETLPASAEEVRAAWERVVRPLLLHGRAEGGGGVQSHAAPPPHSVQALPTAPAPRVALVFFSPSGVQAVMACEEAAGALRGVGAAGELACLALGPTTAACLTNAHVRVAGVAPSPDADGVRAVVDACRS